MTDEEHQNQWPRAQAFINYAARNKPAYEGADYDMCKAKEIISETGYGREYLDEIAASIKLRAEKFRSDHKLMAELLP